MNYRKLSLTAGISYLIIFFTAIFANFVVLESLFAAPWETVQNQAMNVRWGVMAFLVAALFDVVVAWALYELYKSHILSALSSFFRIIHAAIMGMAVFALIFSLRAGSPEEVLLQADIFNTIWLIGLFFFGAHLILLGRIIGQPKFIAVFLLIAGIMYIVDTSAHFLLPNYDDYAQLFLILVAVPSIFGEMALSLWLLFKGGK